MHAKQSNIERNRVYTESAWCLFVCVFLSVCTLYKYKWILYSVYLSLFLSFSILYSTLKKLLANLLTSEFYYCYLHHRRRRRRYHYACFFFVASFPVAHLSKWIIHIRIRMCWMSLATVLSDGTAVVCFLICWCGNLNIEIKSDTTFDVFYRFVCVILRTP